MKILVAVKRVIDFNVKVRVKPDSSGVETTNVKMSMNPFDEIAIEEAVRLKESGVASEIIVVSIGPEVNQDILRQALAIGADRAILVKHLEEIEPLSIAKILHKLTITEAVEMVILGKQSIDGDNNQTGQMLAALLGWPQATFASKVEIINGTAEVTREIDGGLETLRLKVPVVITTDLRLNTPRYASLPNIMKAKQKSLKIITAADLDVDTTPHLEILKVESPLPRKPGVVLKSVSELLAKLHDDLGLI